MAGYWSRIRKEEIPVNVEYSGDKAAAGNLKSFAFKQLATLEKSLSKVNRSIGVRTLSLTDGSKIIASITHDQYRVRVYAAAGSKEESSKLEVKPKGLVFSFGPKSNLTYYVVKSTGAPGEAKGVAQLWSNLEYGRSYNSTEDGTVVSWAARGTNLKGRYGNGGLEGLGCYLSTIHKGMLLSPDNITDENGTHYSPREVVDVYNAMDTVVGDVVVAVGGALTEVINFNTMHNHSEYTNGITVLAGAGLLEYKHFQDVFIGGKAVKGLRELLQFAVVYSAMLVTQKDGIWLVVNGRRMRYSALDNTVVGPAVEVENAESLEYYSPDGLQAISSNQSCYSLDLDTWVVTSAIGEYGIPPWIYMGGTRFETTTEAGLKIYTFSPVVEGLTHDDTGAYFHCYYDSLSEEFFKIYFGANVTAGSLEYCGVNLGPVGATVTYFGGKEYTGYEYLSEGTFAASTVNTVATVVHSGSTVISLRHKLPEDSGKWRNGVFDGVTTDIFRVQIDEFDSDIGVASPESDTYELFLGSRKVIDIVVPYDTGYGLRKHDFYSLNRSQYYYQTQEPDGTPLPYPLVFKRPETTNGIHTLNLSLQEYFIDSYGSPVLEDGVITPNIEVIEDIDGNSLVLANKVLYYNGVPVQECVKGLEEFVVDANTGRLGII